MLSLLLKDNETSMNSARKIFIVVFNGSFW